MAFVVKVICLSFLLFLLYFRAKQMGSEKIFKNLTFKQMDAD